MILRLSRVPLPKAILRFYTDVAGTKSGSSLPSGSSTTTAASTNVNVPGLSEACIKPASEPVGPGVDPKKSGAYKVPEYYCYNNMSYFEAEIEMSKYRCEQPSAK